MSFFFTKQKPAKAHVRGYSHTPERAQALALAGCKACPLNTAPVQTPKMAPTLVSGADLYFLAEAPGRDEDEHSGRPLTGPSGALLRQCLPDGFEASFDNVVNCFTGDTIIEAGNRTPEWREVECCRPRRVKWIEEVKPKLIVGLGVVPLQWATGSTDISGLRGRVLALQVGSHACWFMPTYHPSFILRNAHDKSRPLNSRLGHCFRLDILRGISVSASCERAVTFNPNIIGSNVRIFHSGGDINALCGLFDLAKRAPAKAIDLETKGLRPYGSQIMTAAISFGDTNFAFSIDHPKSSWSISQRKTILERFADLLKDDTVKVAHNAPFELEWLISYFGPQVLNHCVWEDTMMQAHFLDERKGSHRDSESSASRYQGLDFLIKAHFGLTYKASFKLNKKDMSKSDLTETLRYNAADTKFTLKLWERQNRLLKAAGLYEAYVDALPRQTTVAMMQHIGVPVDQKAVKAAQNELEPQIKDINGKIADLRVVKDFAAQKGNFNPQSNPDLVAIFRDYLKRKEVEVKKGDKVSYSTDKAVLDQIDHPLAGMILALREKNKLKSTYIDGLELGRGDLIYPDGKLHTSFNTCLTETGRLSSDSPNLQNYPKRKNSWVRRLVVPPPGHVMIAIDYGQLEACTGAMCSRDPYLVKALWNDYDIHMEWAVKLAERLPVLIGGKINDRGVMRKFRSLVKNKWTFPAFYGASVVSIKGYLESATGLTIDDIILEDLFDEFWETFVGFKRWQDRLMKQYYEIGYVETMVGRRHHYPLTRNQAINMPIQGTAAELVCDAMVRLSALAADTGQWHLHPVLNIHDDMTFLVPDDDATIEEAVRIFTREMLTFDYDWINVPLSIEVSMGPNWAELDHFDKYWSNKL